MIELLIGLVDSLLVTAATEIYNYSIRVSSAVNALASRPGSCLISESFSRLYDSKVSWRGGRAKVIPVAF